MPTRGNGAGRTRRPELLVCERWEEVLGHWRNARLVTRQVFAKIRRSGRVTLHCPLCSARTDVSVRRSPTIWMGGD